MFGIIKWIEHFFSRTITAVEKWVLRAIHAVYSYITRLFDDLRRAVNDVWKSLVNFGRAVDKFLARVVTFANWIVRKYIPSVISWAVRNFDSLLNDVRHIIDWVGKWIARLYNDIVSAVRNITAWVIAHIWQPLFDAITIAWHWITHEGYFVWRIITHPDLLMKIIGSYLWMSYLSLIKHYSVQIAKWLIHGMLNLPNEFADVLESIIANML